MAWTSGLTGRIIEQGAPDYEEARSSYNSRFSKYPKLIVYCQVPEDAMNAIQWVRIHKIPFRVRCGGHSYEAFSLLDGGLVIDVSELLHIEIDKEAGTARIGAGFRLKPLYEALWKQGVTIPGGTCPSVGISGLSLGGGYGFLSRLYGMTCDTILEIELVDSRGKLVHANDSMRSDLFWACRGGGGGSFGIVTSITFQVHPIGDVAHYSMAWDFADLEKVVTHWQSWAPHTDSRLTSNLNLPSPKQGDIVSNGLFVGLEKELRSTVRSLQEAVPPKKITFRSSSWVEAIRRLGGGEIQHVKFKNSSAYAYTPFTGEAIDTLERNLQQAPGPSNMVSFVAYGGAIGQIPPDSTAFVHRKALFVMQYQTYWEQDELALRNIEWVEQFRESMLPYTHGAYCNYCDSLISDWPNLYFGVNIARLKHIKQAYDPENLFRFEQSIPLQSE